MGFKNNIKGSVKAFICGALIANLSVGAMISANAASSSQGAVLRISEAPYTYNAYNIITMGTDSQGKFATASTAISVTNASSLNAGYMGVDACIYNDRGTYIGSSGIRYNSANTQAIVKPYTIRVEGNEAYYSDGYVKVWNGNGYTSYNPNRSPSLNNYR